MTFFNCLAASNKTDRVMNNECNFFIDIPLTDTLMSECLYSSTTFQLNQTELKVEVNIQAKPSFHTTSRTSRHKDRLPNFWNGRRFLQWSPIMKMAGRNSKVSRTSVTHDLAIGLLVNIISAWKLSPYERMWMNNFIKY